MQGRGHKAHPYDCSRGDAETAQVLVALDRVQRSLMNLLCLIFNTDLGEKKSMNVQRALGAHSPGHCRSQDQAALKGVRGRYTNINLWFYIVCLDADASVITGVVSGNPIMVILRCSCLPICLCSKCLAPVAAGGGSCCQGAVGSSRNGSLHLLNPLLFYVF